MLRTVRINAPSTPDGYVIVNAEDVQPGDTMWQEPGTASDPFAGTEPVPVPAAPRRGRPMGSKNKPKEQPDATS